MEGAVDGLVRDFVLYLDEVRVSEWEDRKTKCVAVPASLRGQTIHHGVNQNLKHVTIVACMAAMGKHLIPCILISQASKSLHMDLQKYGIKIGRHLIMRESQKAYVKGTIFTEYIKSEFLRHIAILFTGGPKVCDLPFQSMPEKGRRDSIIGTNKYPPVLLAVKKSLR
jgi:hypothetical protein